MGGKVSLRGVCDNLGYWFGANAFRNKSATDLGNAFAVDVDCDDVPWAVAAYSTQLETIVGPVKRLLDDCGFTLESMGNPVSGFE